MKSGASILTGYDGRYSEVFFCYCVSTNQEERTARQEDRRESQYKATKTPGYVAEMEPLFDVPVEY